jgi:FixJ family two-component response regulator
MGMVTMSSAPAYRLSHRLAAAGPSASGYAGSSGSSAGGGAASVGDGPGDDAAPRVLVGEGGTVLVVDDEPGIVESLAKIFSREGLTVLSATDGNAGLELLRKHRVGVLLTDLMMPRTSGMDLLRAAKTLAPETEVVLMTAYGTVETAVEAMKEGAYDFVTKPLKRAHVVRIVRNALEKQSLVFENRALRAQLAERRQRAIIGTSLAWRRTMDVIVQAAPSEASVLLLGESGTGKELLSRAIHDESPRAEGPFVAINVRGASPETLLESGAVRPREGRLHRRGRAAPRARFEAAHGGTLFLDEIGDISPKRAGQAAAGAARSGSSSRVGHRGGRSHHGRRAHHRGHQPSTCQEGGQGRGGSATTCSTGST